MFFIPKYEAFKLNIQNGYIISMFLCNPNSHLNTYGEFMSHKNLDWSYYSYSELDLLELGNTCPID